MRPVTKDSTGCSRTFRYFCGLLKNVWPPVHQECVLRASITLAPSGSLGPLIGKETESQDQRTKTGKPRLPNFKFHIFVFSTQAWCLQRSKRKRTKNSYVFHKCALLNKIRWISLEYKSSRYCFFFYSLYSLYIYCGDSLGDAFELRADPIHLKDICLWKWTSMFSQKTSILSHVCRAKWRPISNGVSQTYMTSANNILTITSSHQLSHYHLSWSPHPPFPRWLQQSPHWTPCLPSCT